MLGHVCPGGLSRIDVCASAEECLSLGAGGQKLFRRKIRERENVRGWVEQPSHWYPVASSPDIRIMCHSCARSSSEETRA